jgi:hypothetical protein
MGDRFMRSLFQENNVISLRTATVNDDGNITTFRLEPADYSALIPKGRTRLRPQDLDWARQDSAWLFRHLRSQDDEAKLRDALPCLEQNLLPTAFEPLPKFRLIWTNSGNSVAIYVNNEPWAFVDEQTHAGYSKGLLKAGYEYKRPWDQKLFEKIFLT